MAERTVEGPGEAAAVETPAIETAAVEPSGGLSTGSIPQIFQNKKENDFKPVLQVSDSGDLKTAF